MTPADYTNPQDDRDSREDEWEDSRPDLIPGEDYDDEVGACSDCGRIVATQTLAFNSGICSRCFKEQYGYDD